MYGANAQNTQLNIRTELAKCSYNQSFKDYITNMIMQVMNYPKKTNPPRHFIKTMNQDKIIMIWYPMNVPFGSKSYNVPLQIYIMKNVPYEPPQIFLEVVQGSAANPTNKDINPNTRQILTNTLRNWSQYSNIDNAMNEIFASFTKVFPIYKTTGSNQNSAYNNNTGTSGGGSIYNALNNEVKNSYQQNKYGQGLKSAYYQPHQTSIYGRSMTLEGQKNESASGGSFGSGIYSNQNNNNPTNSSTFGGGIYGNQNNNYYIPPSSGIYGNNNQNQYGNNNQYGNQYGNNNYNNNQYGYNNPVQPNYMGVNSNPDEEFKNILVNEISEKISRQLIDENKRLNSQNQKLNEYKNQLGEENIKIQNFVNNQFDIKTKCEDDMSAINKAINQTKDYNENNRQRTLNKDNCLSFVDIPDSGALKVIASEVSMEEMILLVRKGFERKKVSFEDAISFMRNSSRDLFTIKFLKNKVIRRYDSKF